MGGRGSGGAGSARGGGSGGVQSMLNKATSEVQNTSNELIREMESQTNGMLTLRPVNVSPDGSIVTLQAVNTRTGLAQGANDRIIVNGNSMSGRSTPRIIVRGKTRKSVSSAINAL